jgi:very-short-patch-repair endonuclease
MPKNLVTTKFHLPYDPQLVERAKELRKMMTVAEKKLWDNYLKTFPLRVLRQRPIAHFIVDFYCPALKLVIEVDGEVHFTATAEAYDQARTDILEGYGLTVMRFTNQQVLDDFDEVCSQIARRISLNPPSSCRAEKEGGF